MKKGLLLIGLILLFGLMSVWAGIDSVVAHDFTTGEQGSLEVKFTNVSTVSANFYVLATCTNNIAMEGVPVTKGVVAGAQTTVLLPIVGSCSTATTGSCVVTVEPIGGTAETASVNIECSPLTMCTPYQRVCLDNSIKECSADGVRWVTLQACGNLQCGVATAGGALACVEDGPDYSGLLIWAIFLVVLIVIGFAIYRIFHSRQKN